MQRRSIESSPSVGRSLPLSKRSSVDLPPPSAKPQSAKAFTTGSHTHTHTHTQQTSFVHNQLRNGKLRGQQPWHSCTHSLRPTMAIRLSPWIPKFSPSNSSCRSACFAALPSSLYTKPTSRAPIAPYESSRSRNSNRTAYSRGFSTSIGSFLNKSSR